MCLVFVMFIFDSDLFRILVRLRVCVYFHIYVHPEWNAIESDGELHLQRVYHFPDFQTALDFTNQVGAEAEKEGHHPSLLTEWGKVTVTWWTHAISGLHQNDLIMAAKTDAIEQNLTK